MLRPKQIKPFSLSDFQKHVASLPTYVEAKMTMPIEKAQEMVDLVRSLEPPFNDPEWCDSTQAIIDAKVAEIEARKTNDNS